MFHNNYMRKETQNQFVNSFSASIQKKLKPLQDKIITAKEFKAPENPFDKLVYLVKANLQGIHEFKNKPQELKEDRTYIKLMLVNLVQSEITRIVTKYNSANSKWNMDKLKCEYFIQDYNSIINKALSTYDIINKILPLQSFSFGFLKTIPKKAESTEILSHKTQLFNDIKNYNVVRKHMRSIVELDLKEIQIAENAKKEYVISLPSEPVTLEEMKAFLVKNLNQLII